MSKFSTQHPFIDSLFKRVIRIVVTWNVVVVCITGTLILLGIFGAIAALFAQNTSTGYVYQPVHGYGTNQLVSIKISGVIVGSNDTGGSLGDAFGAAPTYGYEVKEQLMFEADNDTASGIILEIDSPGGTIYGAHAIADGVAYYKEKTHKPVYAHIQGVGASGAYWAAASADKIFVDYGSEVGSIGVIMGPFEYYDKPVASDGGVFGAGGVVTQNGIESVTITAGTSKDIGNPYRKLTDKEIQSLQKMVNNEYDEFVKYISERRKISESEIRDTIGAMGYDPKTAVELKLVDKIGSRETAYQALAEAAKVGEDFYVTRLEREPSAIESLFSAVSLSPKKQVSSQNSVCTLSQSVLAYHGDVAALCKKS